MLAIHFFTVMPSVLTTDMSLKSSIAPTCPDDLNVTTGNLYEAKLNCTSWCQQFNETQTLTLDMAFVHYIYQITVKGDVESFVTNVTYKSREVDTWKTLPAGQWITSLKVSF